MNWDEFTREVVEVSKLTTGKYDFIIGVARGGIIPAVLLARLLEVKDLLTLKVRREGDRHVLVGDITTDIKSKKILLVEDALETGKSLDFLKQHLEEKGALITTACLFILTTTNYRPDYSLSEHEILPVFPWD